MITRLTALLACLFIALPCQAENLELWNVVQKLQDKEWVDLTHSFDEATPHWKGLKGMRRTVLYNHEQHGFRIDELCVPGQWGTHVDPPMHFHKGLKALDEIPVKEMLLPLVVLDVHEKVQKNPDYQLAVEDVNAWEQRHGPIPPGSFVAMRTDWSKRWPDNKQMQNLDDNGIAHYPGWSKEALTFLVESRQITAIGHETTDTDPGAATSKDDYSLETYILKTNRFQIELLASLDRVPEAGSIVIVSWPKPAQGSGSPARVFAILP